MKDTKMEATKETKVEISKTLTVTLVKQTQKCLNLDTQEDADITVVTKKYGVPLGMEPSTALKLASGLFANQQALIAALLKRAEQISYQESKDAALASGNFLSSQLKSKIVGIMSSSDSFAEVSAKECFARWLAGYKDGKKSAVTLLERAKASEEFSDL
jgi:hypothetical protein